MESLTKRENEVAFETSMGLSEKMVGDKLNISPKTVSKHKQTIREKTGANNDKDLTRMYVLSNLHKFLITVVFLAIQMFTVFVTQDGQERMFRRASKSGKRTRKELII